MTNDAIDQIILEGSVARHIRTTILNEVPIEELAPHLTTKIGVVFPLMPTAGATRLLSFDPQSGTGLLLVERAPRKHHMRVEHYGGSYPEDEERGKEPFYVQLPYQYFAFNFNYVERGNTLANFSISYAYLFWRTEPIRTLEDHLWAAATPNIDDSGSICFGSTIQPGRSFSEHIDTIINEFYVHTFNQDLGHYTPFDHSMTEWEKASDNEDPLAWKNWPYWEDTEPVTKVKDLHEYMAVPRPTDRLQLSPSFVALPELPQSLTILRAQQWFEGLTDQQRARLLIGIRNSGLEEATP